MLNRTISGDEYLVRLGGNSCLKRSESLLTALPHQIAGHGSEGDGEAGILRSEDGHILKPLQPPPRGQREAGFYRALNASDDPTDVRIRTIVPRFFGVEQVGFVNGLTRTKEYLVLENVMEGMKLPNVMDVKIGSQTWGPDASAQKIVQESAKYVGTKQPLGFSVLGLIRHTIRSDSDVWVKYDKSFGKSLKTEAVSEVPHLFFDAHQSGIIPQLVAVVVRRMKDILNVYECQTKYNCYASSLLMSYDAAVVREFLVDGDESKLEAAVNMKLIDFAHVFPSDGEHDENFLFGLKNLIEIFEKLL